MYDLGRRLGMADFEALGLAFQGLVLARLGRLAQGFPLVDEGMALASSGRLSPMAAGEIYCRTIWTCIDLFD